MPKEIEKNVENKGLIAISNTLARAKDGMTMQEKKLMVIFLSKLVWKEKNNDLENSEKNLEIWVDKREIMEKLGSEIDTTDQSAYLRKLAQDMTHHSELHFEGHDRDEWEDMPLFTRRKSTRNQLMIEVYSGARKLIEELQCEYITLFLNDILQFDSNVDGSRAYTLYEYLRLHSDTREINTRVISTKEFKELFKIPKEGKGSYMQYDSQKGKEVFNRTNFEKYVINPVLTMLAKCEHVVLHNFGKNKDGKPILYRKVKKNGMVQGYEVVYSINRHPTTIKRQTIIDVQKNPETLKVAQDIMESRKKKSDQAKDRPEGEKPMKSKNTFNNNLHQRSYSTRFFELMQKWEEVGLTETEEQELKEEMRRATNDEEH